MKRLLVVLAIFFSAPIMCTSSSINAWGSYDPVITVVLMVKNEEPVIVQTVDPFIKGGIDSFLIFDTGSTDNTIAVVEEHFKKNGVTSYVIEQEPFIDFATSRNRALELAECHFPRAGYFIMPDAEWYIQGAEALRAFCTECLIQGAPDKMLSLRAIFTSSAGEYSNNSYVVPRLFKADAHIRFEGVVHEIPDCHDVTMIVPDVLIDHRPSSFGDDKTHKRIIRDIALLSAELEKHPDNPRTLFYLAQSHTVLGEYKKAIEYLTKRIAIEGFAEERFVALVRLGQIYEQLYITGEVSSWDQAEYYFLQAYYYRPSRAEPLIHLANHYLYVGEYKAAYSLISRACSMPLSQDSLSINKELYDFNRWDIMARAAFIFGYHDQAVSAAEIALRVAPETNHLKEIIARCRSLSDNAKIFSYQSL